MWINVDQCGSMWTSRDRTDADDKARLKAINHSANTTLQTSHSLMVKRPFTWPVKAWLDSGFRAYLKLLQLMGNSAFDFSTLELSTMQMSQHPKMGPLSGLQAIANCARLRLNFSLRSTEKMKEVMDLSAAQCFLVEFQARGVQPPITFPYSVSRMVIVSLMLSHFLWNSATEKPFSLARYSRETDLRAGLVKRERMYSWSLVTLKLRPGISLEEGGLVEREVFADLRGEVQRSLMRSRWWSMSFSIFWHSSLLKLVSRVFSSCMKRVERIWFMQTPEMLLQFCSLMRLMKFMVSWLKPKSPSHFLKARCSSLTFLMIDEKRFSISSWSWNISGIFVLGFSQIMFSSQDHCIFSHLSWNRAHSLLVTRPCSQMKAGLRQLALTQIMWHLFPQMQSGQFFMGLLITTIQYTHNNTHPTYAPRPQPKPREISPQRQTTQSRPPLQVILKSYIVLLAQQMNPESKEGPCILRNSSVPAKLFRGDSSRRRTQTCHSQVNSMAQMGTSWRLRNNFLHTRSNIQQTNPNKKHHLSRQLCRTLTEATTTDQLTKTMLRRLKTEAEDIDRTPKLVTGLTKLKQMHLLMARDLKRVTYEGKRKREVATDFHCRKTNPGYGRSLCGRFYTS